MTSNIGSNYLLENTNSDFIDENIRDAVMRELKGRFKPEFLNRLDDIILFKQLNNEGIKKIIDIFLETVKKRLKDKNITMSITEEAKELLAMEGYDPVYGARPLKRYLENTLETSIARMIIAGEINDGCNIIVDAKNDSIVIE
jgi:ATP-dependent Clp protease ATP-binding subunit ClpB